MRIIEKSQLITTNDIVVVEDTSLDIKWFIDVERRNGELIHIKETMNPDLFLKQGGKYMSDVYIIVGNELNKNI